MERNRLFYGDNLEVLKQSIPANTVDLVYLDPPFNSARNYNVIFDRHNVVGDDSAQIHAFEDTWRWTPSTDEQYNNYVGGALPSRVADALASFRGLLGENDAMAYLVNMAPRLVELHRVLKSTGSLYLHCDSTMSHYLKVLTDAIFGAELFRNEIIWKRTSGHSDAKGFGRVHDVILFYLRSPKALFHRVFQPYDADYVEQYYRYIEDGTGRRFMSGDLSAAGLSGGGYSYEWKGVTRVWRCPIETMERYEQEGRIFYTKNGFPRLKRYLDEARGMPAQDIWSDIEALRSWHDEKLDYQTQKPMALLERIISASTEDGQVILDPFCGCGTSIDAAQKLGREWIGIDVTYIAIDLIEKRLQHRYGATLEGTYEILGIPRDKAAALALFKRNPFDFERWAVSLLSAQPNQRQVGDKGVDGVARFPLDNKGSFGRILVSVKGGKQISPSMVRDLGGTLTTQKAQMGILITNTPPTRGMMDEANHAGTYRHPHYPQAFPRIQLITVDQLLSGERPKMPPVKNPYTQALRAEVPADQASLFDL